MRKRRLDRAKLLENMAEIVNCRVNDAVKLAFLKEEGADRIDGMDLAAVAEFRRGKDGAVEMKFINRIAALERLLELADGGETVRAEAFFRALDQKTKRGDDGGV